MERIYKTMRNTGAASIAVGIVVASVGLAAGIIATVSYTHLTLPTTPYV